MLQVWKGYFFLFGAACCFATGGVAGESLFRLGVNPLIVASWRILLACLALFIMLLLTNPRLFIIKSKDLPFFILQGLVGIAAFQAFYFTTINLTSVATAVTLLYTGPSFIVIISYFIFKEPVTKVKATALILTLAGCVLVSAGGDFASLSLGWGEPGFWTGLATGFAYAVYAIFGKLFMGGYDARTILFYSFLFGAIPLMVLSPPWLTAELMLAPASSMYLIYLALVPTILAYGLFLKGLYHVEAGRAGIFSTFEPVVAAILAYLLLDQLLSGVQFIGFFLVLLALVILLSPVKKKAAGGTAY